MKCPKCGTEFYGDKCPNCGYEPSDYDVAIYTLMQLAGVGRKRAEELYKAGYKDVESIAKSDEEKLASVHTIGKELAKKIKKEAEEFSPNQDTEFVEICPVCGAIVPPGADRCPKCGTPVSEFKRLREEGENKEQGKPEENPILDKAICPFCGALIPKDAKTCPVCGANLENVQLEEPKPMEDPTEVLKKFFGVSEIPEEVDEEDEQADIRVCPNCGAIVVNKDVCPFCGTPLPKIENVPKKDIPDEVDLSETIRVCPNCGAFVPPDTDICPVCGSKIDEEEEVTSVSLAELMHPMPSTMSVEENTEERSISKETADTGVNFKEEGEGISASDLEEIGSIIGENESESTDETPVIDKEQVEDILQAIGAGEEELSEADLEELKAVFSKGDLQENKKSEKIESKALEKEKTVPEVKITPPASFKVEDRKRDENKEIAPEKIIADNFNSLLYNFGSNEDILSFSPLLVTALFVLSSLFIPATGINVMKQTVSFFMITIGFIAGIMSYMKLADFSRRSLLYGVLFSLEPLITFLPYSPYLFIGVFAILIYVHYRDGINYWLPLSAGSIAFGIQLNTGNHIVEYSIFFTSLFAAHLVTRYRELSMGIVASAPITRDPKVEGFTAFREKRYYDAVYLLRQALTRNPKDVDVMNTLGLAYGRIGNQDMALEMFKKVVEIKPDYKYAWNNMGNVYARMENYDKAIECYKKALEIDPNYSDALLNMGYVMIRRGSYDEAMKMAEKIKAVT